MTVAIILGTLAVIAILFYLFPILDVEGDSMYPTLKPKDKLLACRIFSRKDFKEGTIYVIKSPDDEKRYLIKRLSSCRYEMYTSTKLYFLGDNLGHSYDSRHFGSITPDKVVAKVIFP